MEKVIAQAEEIGVRQINLQVVAANGTAVRLYESCAFRRFGLEKDSFKHGADYFDVAYYALHVVG